MPVIAAGIWSPSYPLLFDQHQSVLLPAVGSLTRMVTTGAVRRMLGARSVLVVVVVMAPVRRSSQIFQCAASASRGRIGGPRLDPEVEHGNIDWHRALAVARNR